MSQRWAIRFEVAEPAKHKAAVESLGQLRLLEGTQVCHPGESLWVSGPQLNEELTAVLQSLPCGDRFVVSDDGTLTKFGERTPSGTIPEVEWTSLRDFIEPELPVAGLTLARIARVPFTLVRANGRPSLEPAALLVSAQVAAEWAATAPQVRLDPLTFAASSDGRILFKGKPLPSLSGTRLTEQEGVLVPAGWAWSPAIDTGSLRETLEVAAEEFVILTQDGKAQRISQRDFVQASRIAIRLSGVSKKS